MPVHHLRTGTLYVLVLVSVITGLVCGSEAVRWVMAGLLLKPWVSPLIWLHHSEQPLP
jgi:TRAP-type C4-dicarboxylate transport system permease large subunit